MSRVPTPEQVRDEMVAKLTRFKEGFLLFECFEEAANMLAMATRLRDVVIVKKSKTTVAWGEPPVLSKEEYIAKLDRDQAQMAAEERATSKEQILQDKVAPCTLPFDPLSTTVVCPKGTKIVLGDDVYEQTDDASSTSWKRTSSHDGISSWCCLSNRAVYELYKRGVKFIFPEAEKIETKEGD